MALMIIACAYVVTRKPRDVYHTSGAAALEFEQERPLLARRLGVAGPSLGEPRDEFGTRWWYVGHRHQDLLVVRTHNSVVFSAGYYGSDSYVMTLEPLDLQRVELDGPPPTKPRDRLALALGLAGAQRLWSLPLERIKLHAEVSSAEEPAQGSTTKRSEYLVEIRADRGNWWLPKEMSLFVNVTDRAIVCASATFVDPPTDTLKK